jgi:monomeric sarcosine oxidase
VNGVPELDVAIVGGGLMGAATAWAATRRGLSVALFEQFSIGHDLGSSHGPSRIFRYVYQDEFYVRLVGQARESWRELELDAGHPLLRQTGGLDYGAERDPAALADILREVGVSHELLPADEAGRRWPGLVFDTPVLFQPDAGVLDSGATVLACLARAAERGASIHADTAVTAVHTDGDNALLQTGLGNVRARRVVVAAGAWVRDLVGALVSLPPITVTQELTAHFRRVNDLSWPTFVHKGDLNAYGLPAGTGSPEHYKVAEFRGGPVLAGADQRITDTSAVRARLVDFVARRLPGLDPEPTYEASCLFTSTPSDDFVLDRQGPVIVCSPCSGHGAKFAPLIGELVTDLAQDSPAADARFGLLAHAGRQPARA